MPLILGGLFRLLLYLLFSGTALFSIFYLGVSTIDFLRSNFFVILAILVAYIYFFKKELVRKLLGRR